MPKHFTNTASFEAKYQAEVDPWQYATRAYEQDRYAKIVGALGSRRFRRVFEPGCSIGILTEKLAGVCDQVVAMDISATAVSRTKDRCRWLRNVGVTEGPLPKTLPEGTFDLIVLSDIGFYFDPPTLTMWVSQLVGRMDPKGILMAAHWLGTASDLLQTADQVHEIIDSVAGLHHDVSHRYEGFRIDKWTRVGS